MEYINYEPQGLALSIFKQRYAITETETFAEACDRVAYRIAHAETGEAIDNPESTQNGLKRDGR